MGKLSAAVGADGILTVDGGPVQVRCYGWVDIDQDDRCTLTGAEQRSSSERGHRFEGAAELDQLRVAAVERFGDWTALVLPRGSRLLVADRLTLPRVQQHTASAAPAGSHAQPAVPQQPAPSPSAKQAARTIAGAVLALVLLDLFNR